MKRTTIDFGIDLGTTNSAVAVLNDTNIEVIKNNDGNVLTPSAVWINKKGKLYVGKRAKSRSEEEPQNAYTEFKLQMGTDVTFEFKDSGKSYRAEGLSAEILKSLKADVKHMHGEDINAAVITVPAAFELPQIEATQKAAELAGFSKSPLLQEPIAAALAYGFKSKSDKVFWLIYDFGGGTFDAAVMQIKGGEINVVNHMGDNHLGGKLIDWALVDKVFVPRLLKEYTFSDFQRGNPKWSSTFAKLKKAAEEAKIRLSRMDTEEIFITDLGIDDSGEDMELDFVLEKNVLEALAKPLVARTINLCKKVLQEKRLSPSDIEKVILVGGTTLIPYVRQVLADPKEGLGIPLDYSIDPLTVVAQGAAIFAGTQQLQVDIEKVSSNQFALELDYESVGTEKVFDIAGKIVNANEKNFSGFTIEFIEQGREGGHSGKIPLNSEGAFFGELHATEGRKNNYLIELLNSQGIPQETVPQSISYTFGKTISAQTLVHSIGVALANNEVKFFFDKGSPLPQRKNDLFHTALEARAGEDKPVIRIPIIEGENKRADRNMLIGYLNIPGSVIRRTLPAGSEIEVTIDINESRILSTLAFIPDLGTEIEEVIRLGKKTQDIEKQKEEFEREKQRYLIIKEKAETIDDPALQNALKQIEERNMVDDLENTLVSAGQDKDDSDKIQNSLTEFKQAIDEAEKKSKWPLLHEEVETEIERTRSIIDEYGSIDQKRHFGIIEAELQQYIAAGNNNADDLSKKLDELRSLNISILHEQPGYWLAIFNNLKENVHMFPDTQKANILFRKGEDAIRKDSVSGLKDVVRALFELLPFEQQQAMPGGFESTII